MIRRHSPCSAISSYPPTAPTFRRKRRAGDAGVECEVVHHTNDFPAEAIIAAAREKACDCIFMASHGHSGRRGPALGGVTQKVANQASVPVVVYRVEAAG